MFNKNFSVAVMVSDAKKSAEWYEEKLSFETSEEGHWITAWQKGSDWKLHLCKGKELEPGNTGICLYSDDVQKTVEDLKNKGVEFSMDYKKSEGGEVARFDDPDGNIIWISNGGP